MDKFPYFVGISMNGKWTLWRGKPGSAVGVAEFVNAKEAEDFLKAMAALSAQGGRDE